jgi:hypothetical protein
VRILLREREREREREDVQVEFAENARIPRRVFLHSPEG